MNEAEIVGWKYSEGIADDIVQSGAGDIEFYMPGLLLGSLAVKEPALAKDGLDRSLAAAAEQGVAGGSRRGRGRVLRTWRAIEFDRQRLQHTLGLLAARRAEIEALLAAFEQRVG